MNATPHNIQWLVRRELMEHRRLFLAPMILGFVVISLNIILLVSHLIHRSSAQVSLLVNGHGVLNQMPSELQSITATQAVQFGSFLSWVMYTALTLFALALGASLLSYGLGCLFDERRDRSILFWKSMPVTDTETVAAKFITALGLLPLVWAIGALITGWLSVAVYATPVAFAPIGVSALFAQTHLTALTLLVIVAFPVYLLTLIPAVGWVMLCSATARRHPALIAFIVPALFATLGELGWPNPVWHLLLGQILPSGFLNGMALLKQPDTSMLSALAPVFEPLTSPALWLGLLFGLLCLAAATWYRRRYTVLL